MRYIDVHTHMLDRQWLRMLKEKGGPRYTVEPLTDEAEGIYKHGAHFMTPMPGHFDYDLRVRDMDEAGIDLALVSLTCPNVFWGDKSSSCEAARIVNDAMVEGQRRHPERIRWLLSLPWEYPAEAVEELDRAHDNGAVGVMVLANVAGRHLTEDAFQPIWKAIDDKGLAVLVHPADPPGADDMLLQEHSLTATVGFMFDTTLAITRMIFSGFLDRYSKLKIIAAHAGGTVPYLAGRMDRAWEMTPGTRDAIEAAPSSYLKRIYYDAVCYHSEALALCIAVGGIDKVMYGSDYPHDIGDMKGCRARVDALPEEQRAMVAYGNAERIFAL